MRLRIDTIRDRIVCPDTGQQFTLDERHPLHDHPGYSFSVTLATGKGRYPDSYLITSFHNDMAVGIARVHRLSAVAGVNKFTGKPVDTPYLLDLTPGTPVFPAEGIISELLRLGVLWDKIHLLFGTDTRLTESRNGSSELPHLMSDGTMTEGPSLGNAKLLPGWIYQVERASWAIMHTGDRVDGVYLWLPATEAQNEVPDLVSQILNGAMSAT